jgi:hypothetical protein
MSAMTTRWTEDPVCCADEVTAVCSRCQMTFLISKEKLYDDLTYQILQVVISLAHFLHFEKGALCMAFSQLPQAVLIVVLS